MDILFASEKVRKQCTDMKTASKLFGGDKIMVRSLFARMNSLQNAETLKDIIVQPQFRFHKLHNRKERGLEGYFAIDIKTVREPWRLILQPLDKDEHPYERSCSIDEIAGIIRIILIEEVSRHYE